MQETHGQLDNQALDFYDGKLFVTTSQDDFVLQCVGSDKRKVFLINAFTPLDINEIYPGWRVADLSEFGHAYIHLDAPRPKFCLSQLCTYKGKRVYVRSRYIDFRSKDFGWRYIIGICRGGAGTEICKERALYAA